MFTHIIAYMCYAYAGVNKSAMNDTDCLQVRFSTRIRWCVARRFATKPSCTTTARRRRSNSTDTRKTSTSWETSNSAKPVFTIRASLILIFMRGWCIVFVAHHVGGYAFTQSTKTTDYAKNCRFSEIVVPDFLAIVELRRWQLLQIIIVHQ